MSDLTNQIDDRYTIIIKNNKKILEIYWNYIINYSRNFIVRFNIK